MKASPSCPLTMGPTKGPPAWWAAASQSSVPSPADLEEGRQRPQAKGGGASSLAPLQDLGAGRWGPPGQLNSSSFCLVSGTHDQINGRAVLSRVAPITLPSKTAMPLASCRALTPPHRGGSQGLFQQIPRDQEENVDTAPYLYHFPIDQTLFLQILYLPLQIPYYQ